MDNSCWTTTVSIIIIIQISWTFIFWVTRRRRFHTQFYVAFLPAIPSTGFSSGVKLERIPKHGTYFIHTRNDLRFCTFIWRFCTMDTRWRPRSDRSALHPSTNRINWIPWRKTQLHASSILSLIYTCGYSTRPNQHSYSTRKNSNTFKGVIWKNGYHSSTL